MKLLDKIVKNKKNTILFLILVAIISTSVIFMTRGMKSGHDLMFHLSRIVAIKDNLKMGVVGGYIYPNYLAGYGYGNPLFYPDLFLYIPALLSYIGIPILISYKIFLLLISIGSIFAMYVSVHGITKNKKAAMISSILYGFASYRLVDMFTRAALGETLAFVFAPLIIYGIYEIIYGNEKKFYYLVIGMSGLILSHLISTYLICIVLVLLCIINYKKLFTEKKRITYLFLAAGITFLLTSFYTLPMLEQMMTGKFYFNHLDATSDLMLRSLPIWSLFLEIPYHTFVKLWIPSGIGLGFLIMCYFYFKNRKNTNGFTKFCFYTAFILMIVSTNLFPWNLFQNIFSVIQFPWRLYFLVVLLISIGSGILFSKIKIDLNQFFPKFFLVCLIPVVVVGTTSFCSTTINGVNGYEISFGEYMPDGSNEKDILNRGEIMTSSEPVEMNFTRNGLDIDIVFAYNNVENANNLLELPLLYYKGYEANINGTWQEVEKTEHGLVGVRIGNIREGNVKVQYKGTKVQHVSKITSISTLIGVMIVWIGKRRKSHEA